MSDSQIQHEWTVPATVEAVRLDKLVAQWLPQYSRERIQHWIKSGAVTVDGRVLRPAAIIRGGERVRLSTTPEAALDWVSAQPVPFEVIAETPGFLVLNKPAGVVVHPGAGQPAGTLVNGLLHRYPTQAHLPRAGIIHRLDKLTSGLLVVARTLTTHAALVKAMASRVVQRRYLAVVKGDLAHEITVDAPIGRDVRVRTRMNVRPAGRAAVTHLRPLARAAGYSLLQATLETGRTHQIRVHCRHAGFPIVGDATYGVAAPSAAMARQALHAYRLGFVDPITGEARTYFAALPADMQALLKSLSMPIPPDLKASVGAQDV